MPGHIVVVAHGHLLAQHRLAALAVAHDHGQLGIARRIRGLPGYRVYVEVGNRSPRNAPLVGQVVAVRVACFRGHGIAFARAQQVV